jgi:hypothetical protein
LGQTAACASTGVTTAEGIVQINEVRILGVCFNVANILVVKDNP